MIGEGKGREGKGREGKGREEKGREGKAAISNVGCYDLPTYESSQECMERGFRELRDEIHQHKLEHSALNNPRAQVTR